MGFSSDIPFAATLIAGLTSATRRQKLAGSGKSSKSKSDFSPGKATSSAELERALVRLESGVDDDWKAEATAASPKMTALLMITEKGRRMTNYDCHDFSRCQTNKLHSSPTADWADWHRSGHGAAASAPASPSYNPQRIGFELLASAFMTAMAWSQGGVVATLALWSCGAAAFQFHRRAITQPIISPTPRLGSHLSSASDSLPTEAELVQQKSEAYNALLFHETKSLTGQSSSAQIKSIIESATASLMPDDDEASKADYWECSDGALCFQVPMDPAAGLKRGVITGPYKASVQIEMDLSELRGEGAKRKGLRLVETLQFGDGSLPFARSVPLDDAFDVDAVDGTYSFHATQQQGDEAPAVPLVPSSLVAGAIDPSSVHLVVEHTMSCSDTERARCFFIYTDENRIATRADDDEEDEDFAVLAARQAKANDMYRLIGVVLSDENKIMPESDDEKERKGQDYVADYISEVLESPTQSPASPLDLLELSQDTQSSEEDKMKRLMSSIENHNERVVSDALGDSGDNSKMERHSIGMLGLTPGVWLGDAFVREPIPKTLAARIRSPNSKGFGSSKSSDREEDSFASWSVGVQKVALQFKWDYFTNIAQKFTYGKVLGTPTSLSCMANINSEGVVSVNEDRRIRKRGQRRVVWDMDGYVAGLVGSCFFRAPRYVSLSETKGPSSESYLTEFMVFYRDDGKDSKQSSLEFDGEKVQNNYCSRSSRLHSQSDGTLLQGSTAFFSLNRPESEDSSE
ncbi:hypothetical protein THAOC_37395 [Thalassiosira oceanica]|uniref:Uncharacterized protein n=1 Tax=Thalassiosira oceanica TaxID=159749 RepID=K0RC49_THAOC|nr:hypothetical protein THAOC_37395 [Thalassiosira oceanica]|eukprot:EJK44097.1 hypothetical protein THAOC_37395 [Thalassiosira oceanica]